MGSGFNDSLAVGRGARTKASARTPFYFWLSVPVYVYDLECKPGHKFRTRAPMFIDPEDAEESTVWCERCQDFVVIPMDAEPSNFLTSMDIYKDKRSGVIKGTAIEQDNGVLRERIARELQSRGFLENDEAISLAAVEFGVPVAEIKKINAGLMATDSGNADQVDMCRAGLHEMTLDNVSVSRGRRQCKACRNLAQQARRAS
jgi:hypothetical protein